MPPAYRDAIRPAIDAPLNSSVRALERSRCGATGAPRRTLDDGADRRKIATVDYACFVADVAGPNVNLARPIDAHRGGRHESPSAPARRERGEHRGARRFGAQHARAERQRGEAARARGLLLVGR